MGGMLEKLRDAIVNFDEEAAVSEVRNALGSGIPVREILEAIASGLEEVGRRYESHEYFLAELMLCGETAKRAIDVLKPVMEGRKESIVGKVLFGTVKGDIHDIGKTIVSSFLSGAGFLVYDLGVDVDAQKFVEKTREIGPEIVAMSALLSTTAPYMEEVIRALKEAGLRDKVKVIIGGRPVTREFCERIGADATTPNPAEAVAICKGWLSSNK